MVGAKRIAQRMAYLTARRSCLGRGLDLLHLLAWDPRLLGVRRDCAAALRPRSRMQLSPALWSMAMGWQYHPGYNVVEARPGLAWDPPPPPTPPPPGASRPGAGPASSQMEVDDLVGNVTRLLAELDPVVGPTMASTIVRNSLRLRTQLADPGRMAEGIRQVTR